MARIDLDVPYSQKDEAKSLGARWDPQAKTWYIPDGAEVGQLARWLPIPNDFELEHEPEFLVRSPYYYVMESLSDCWKCNALTRVFSFKLPEEHEEFQYIEDDEEEFTLTRGLGEWKSHGHRGTVSNAHSLSPRVVKQMRRFTESFKLAYSKTAGSRYFMNHCQHCGAKLGDFFMHSEPGGAFFPTSPEQANKMILFRINEKFDANCDIRYATDDFMDYMQIGGE
ncbi:DUF5710 domain-containing protein [Halomonas sabkhae]|uniref:DUF5710 domain-containing protein n=1 Tax=Halomonas sabkhae TaxID=626223 RepID=UPI0025B4C11E|nr:DUF5710 domain-containing protein [Halomonas sabkhae]MDN3525293.1 DUF5710 domain-containing protein [Halomonas sabkhae]